MARRVFKEFTIKELSGVDVPAQEPALALIVKHKDGDPSKTTITEKTMDADKQKIVELETTITKNGELIEQLRAEASMSDVQKAHYAKLSDSEKADFRKKSFAERNAILDQIEKANEVVYTATDGTKFRKNDDPRLIAQAKQIDELTKANRTSAEQIENQNFAKRAATYSHLPKTDEVKTAMVRAIEKGVSDEKTRTEIFELLDAANAAAKEGFVAKGKRALTQEELDKSADPDVQLEQYVAKYAKEKNLSVAKAEASLANDETYRKLYEQAEINKHNRLTGQTN